MVLNRLYGPQAPHNVAAPPRPRHRPRPPWRMSRQTPGGQNILVGESAASSSATSTPMPTPVPMAPPEATPPAKRSLRHAGGDRHGAYQKHFPSALRRTPLRRPPSPRRSLLPPATSTRPASLSPASRPRRPLRPSLSTRRRRQHSRCAASSAYFVGYAYDLRRPVSRPGASPAQGPQ